MLQIGTKYVYLYLPSDEPGLVDMGGEYEEKLKRWRFSMDDRQLVTRYVQSVYPEFFREDDDDSGADEEEKEEKPMSPPIDKRLHRAQSFSEYDDYEEDESDESDMERSRSRSQKFKECDRFRPPLSNKQFSKKRHMIKARMY